LDIDAAELEQCRAGSRMRKPSGVTPGRLFSATWQLDIANADANRRKRKAAKPRRPYMNAKTSPIATKASTPVTAMPR
jgi:hypothetical protein